VRLPASEHDHQYPRTVDSPTSTVVSGLPIYLQHQLMPSLSCSHHHLKCALAFSLLCAAALPAPCCCCCSCAASAASASAGSPVSDGCVDSSLGETGGLRPSSSIVSAVRIDAALEHNARVRPMQQKGQSSLVPGVSIKASGGSAGGAPKGLCLGPIEMAPFPSPGLLARGPTPAALLY
jgi:hypothetical protein